MDPDGFDGFFGDERVSIVGLLVPGFGVLA